MSTKNVSFVRLVVLAVTLAPSFLSAQPLFKSPAVVTEIPPFLTGLAVADLNGDGFGDLVVVSAGNVGVLLGHGDGTFGAMHTYLSNVSAIAVEDINGDGNIDVVASGTTVNVLLGNGDGTFQSPIEVDPGTFGQVVLGDVNGDGKVDIVALDGNTVGVWLGKGDGTFGAGQYFAPAGGAKEIALGDVNRDGLSDLVVIDSAGDAGVLLSNGDGTFQPAQTFGTAGTQPISIAAVDLNADGDVDLIVLNKCGASCNAGVVGVLMGNGDGTFQPAVGYSTGAFNPLAMVVQNIFGGTNSPDVLVAECPVNPFHCMTRFGDFGAGRVGVLLSMGDGTFNPAVIYGSDGIDADLITVGNIKGFGALDLVVGNACGRGSGCDQRSNVAVKLSPGRSPTSMSITSSLSPSVLGQPVTFTATVTGLLTTPQGFVRFLDGKHCLGDATLSGGVATLTTSKLPVGTLSITALYVPQPTWQRTSSQTTQAVNAH